MRRLPWYDRPVRATFVLPASFELIIPYSDPATAPLVTRIHLHIVHSWKFCYLDDEVLFRTRNPGA